MYTKKRVQVITRPWASDGVSEAFRGRIVLAREHVPTEGPRDRGSQPDVRDAAKSLAEVMCLVVI